MLVRFNTAVTALSVFWTQLRLRINCCLPKNLWHDRRRVQEVLHGRPSCIRNSIYVCLHPLIFQCKVPLLSQITAASWVNPCSSHTLSRLKNRKDSAQFAKSWGWVKTTRTVQRRDTTQRISHCTLGFKHGRKNFDRLDSQLQINRFQQRDIFHSSSIIHLSTRLNGQLIQTKMWLITRPPPQSSPTTSGTTNDSFQYQLICRLFSWLINHLLIRTFVFTWHHQMSKNQEKLQIITFQNLEASKVVADSFYFVRLIVVALLRTLSSSQITMCFTFVS